MTPTSRPAWPGGARFAFTIFDDTDLTTLANGPAVYDLLDELGLRITKSVWPLDPTGPPLVGGSTCEDPDHLRWVLDLQRRGHEIGYHNASDHSSTRARTLLALDRFEELFGHPPRVGADHAGNVECVYLGADRLSGAIGRTYDASMRRLRPERGRSLGHLPDDPHFWGDALRDRVTYWRSFTFHELDALRSCPAVPYHDPARPYVNWWFTSSHAPTPEPFYELLSTERLDRLEASGGLCILYTHFGAGFATDGVVDPRLRRTLEGLVRRDGWFAPVSEVLDHVRSQRGHDAPLTDAARRRLEARWVLDQTRSRGLGELRRSARRIGSRPRG